MISINRFCLEAAWGVGRASFVSLVVHGPASGMSFAYSLRFWRRCSFLHSLYCFYIDSVWYMAFRKMLFGSFFAVLV